MALQIVCDASDYAQESGRRQRPRESNLRHYRTETLTHNSLALTGQDPTRRVDELVPSRRRPDRELTLSPIFRDLADPRAAPRHSYEEKVERDPFRSLANHSPSPSWPIFVPAHGLLLHKPRASARSCAGDLENSIVVRGLYGGHAMVSAPELWPLRLTF